MELSISIAMYLLKFKSLKFHVQIFFPKTHPNFYGDS